MALLGHSVGAGAVLFEASRRDDIAAVISIAAFAHPEWMMRRYLDPAWLPGPLRSSILRYVEWLIRYRYAEIAPMHTLCRVRCPVLLVHGTADDTVPVSDVHAMRENCPKKSELCLIAGAKHDLVESIEECVDCLIHFLDRTMA